MRIGELSRVTGVSIPTIRVYEREGLIDPALRTNGEFREFVDAQRNRLDIIKRVRNLGFDLDEVKALLMLSDAVGTDECERIVSRICASIEKRKRDLGELEVRLRAAISGTLPFNGIDDAFRAKLPTRLSGRISLPVLCQTG